MLHKFNLEMSTLTGNCYSLSVVDLSYLSTVYYYHTAAHRGDLLRVVVWWAIDTILSRRAILFAVPLVNMQFTQTLIGQLVFSI